VIAVARLRDEVLGVIVVIDGRGTWAAEDRATLDHGAMVLALDLARLRTIAEVELRLGRDLVEELLAGGRLDGIPSASGRSATTSTARTASSSSSSRAGTACVDASFPGGAPGRPRLGRRVVARRP
jgi:hypothetical protein